MLQSYITPSRIANAILQKTAYKGSYIIVEGKNDHTLLKKFTDEEFCQVEIGFGNLNVIEIVTELNKRNYDKAFGIIDADFRVICEEKDLENENILITDDHDLEMMLLKSKAFDIVISHYAIAEKVVAFEKEQGGIGLRDIILKLGGPLGYLKLANKINNFGLVFKPLRQDGNALPIVDFIPSKTLNFSGYEKMIETVFNYSRQKTDIKVSQTDCLTHTKALLNESIDLYQLCNGHDIISIICIGLRQKISNLNSKALKPEELEEALVFTYDSRYFESTKLYALIKDWEQKNTRTILNF